MTALTTHRLALAATAAVAAMAGAMSMNCSLLSTCDSISAAVLLPAPGDTLTLTGRACIDPAEGDEPTLSVWLDTGEIDAPETRVQLSVLEPDDGVELVRPGGLSLDLEPKRAHCDGGLEISIENTSQTSDSVTAVLWLDADALDPELCVLSLEAP